MSQYNQGINANNASVHTAAKYKYDCIVYGHTHIPVCHTTGDTLFINPGSFQGTGTYGAPGTYGLLQVGGKGLSGSIHELIP